MVKIARFTATSDVMASTPISSNISRECSQAATSAPITMTGCITRFEHHRTAAARCPVDLANHRNMMCDPCFMDANQVGFVHELSWEDVKTVLDNAITIKPRRQMSVQFRARADDLHTSLTPFATRQVGYAAFRPPPTASVREEPGVCQGGRRRDCATPTCSLTASATRPTRTPRRQPVRREAARHRALQRRRRHRAGRDDDRQRRQQRAG